MKPNTNKQNCNKVALYGGSFDPVHCAHIQVARSALDQAGLDQVVFIPAARSPLKDQAALASDRDRVTMLQLATEGESGFVVDSRELERGGISYTVDTVAEFRAAQPESELFWILGADQFEQLPRWHRIEELAGMVTFILLRRPGYSIAAPALANLSYIEIDAPLMPHSSTEIRQCLAAGTLPTDLIPSAVEAFISSRGLYTR